VKTTDLALAEPEVGPWKDKLLYGQFRILSLRKDYKGLIARYDQGAASTFTLENKLNVLVLVAEAHRELGERDAAMALYEQIGRDYSTTPQARDAAYARLLMLYDNGDERLLEEVNKFLTENPTAPQVERVSMMKAEALFKAGDFANALPIYKIVVEKSKGLSPALWGEAEFKLGWCHSQLQHYQETIDVFGDFIAKYSGRPRIPDHPKIPAALAQRGAALMQLKRYSEAQKNFQVLTANHPGAKEREFGLENLALIYSQLGDQGHMAETFEILLRDFPETKAKAKANFWVGRASFEAKDYRKAPPFLEKARELDPPQYFERASLAIMACYFNLEDLAATEKEIEFYRSHGGLADTPSDVIRWLAQEYNKRGDYAKAEKYFPELINRKESIDDDKLQLARARVKLGKFNEAVESFNSYLDTVKEPTLRMRALLEKADAQIEQKDFTHAEETVKAGLSTASEGKFNGEFRLRAGEIEVGRGNTRKALQIFEAIPLTLDDEELCPRAMERAITLHRQSGEEDAAKKLENQLRSKYPEYLQKKRRPKS
jgi:tetratricopeptide (TPR) repeat protein